MAITLNVEETLDPEGIPTMEPVELRVSPAGSGAELFASENTMGDTPPVEASVWL